MEKKKSIWQRAKEMEYEENGGNIDTGYVFKTTFYSDFSIADAFGIDAIKDTYERAFAEYKTDTIYLTELVLVLNWKCCIWYDKNKEFSSLYCDLYEKTNEYALDNLKGEDMEYYYKCTD